MPSPGTWLNLDHLLHGKSFGMRLKRLRVLAIYLPLGAPKEHQSSAIEAWLELVIEKGLLKLSDDAYVVAISSAFERVSVDLMIHSEKFPNLQMGSEVPLLADAAFHCTLDSMTAIRSQIEALYAPEVAAADPEDDLEEAEETLSDG